MNQSVVVIFSKRKNFLITFYYARCMEVTTIHSGSADYPKQLTRLTKPPAALYCQGRGLPDIMSRKRLAVVGSRAVTAYGREVTRNLVRQVAAQGVVIVSGMAYGVDAEAHRAALEAGGITMAVLPSPVEAPAPSGNLRLSRDILRSGGALLSSYPAGSDNHRYNFVERNEYVAALSDAVLIIEGAIGSGTNRTSDFALGLNMTLLAVPGQITAKSSSLPNKLIQDGAPAIWSAQDVLNELGIGTQLTLNMRRGDTSEEQAILDLIYDGLNDGPSLLVRTGQPIDVFNQSLTMLEIAGKIRPLGGNHWGLA